jgi:hypothetical protein
MSLLNATKCATGGTGGTTNTLNTVGVAALWAWSLAVHVTNVWPIANSVPEPGLHAAVPASSMMSCVAGDT